MIHDGEPDSSIFKLTSPWILLCPPHNFLRTKPRCIQHCFTGWSPSNDCSLDCWAGKISKLKLLTKGGQQKITSPRYTARPLDQLLKNCKILSIFSRCKGTLRNSILLHSWHYCSRPIEVIYVGLSRDGGWQHTVCRPDGANHRFTLICQEF